MKLWGGQSGPRPSPRAEAFTSSIGFDHRLWPYDLTGSAAHCRMLARQGIVPPDDAQAILAGLKNVRDELVAGALDWSPQWEDIHSWVESRLHQLVGKSAGWLHTARSRNDQVALDLRLYAREAILDEIDAIMGVERALLDLASQHTETLAPGYTHLQRAQPIVLAHFFLAYVEMFQRDAGRLLDCYHRTDVLPLGSGALAGVPYPIDRSFVAHLLGFSALSSNSMDAVADRDFVVEQVSALALVAMHLSRLSEELVLWSTAEFAFTRMGDAYTTGSSIMPQKHNPDVAELVRAKTGRMYGHLMALLTVLKGQPLAYNRDLQEDKEPLFDAVDTALGCLNSMADVLASLDVATDRLAAAAGEGFALATDYADYLAKKGIPFREAHALVSDLVQACEASGRQLADLTLAELQAACPLFEADMVGFQPQAAVSARNVPGGTAPEQVKSAYAAALDRLEEVEAQFRSIRAQLPDPEGLLSAPLVLT